MNNYISLSNHPLIIRRVVKAKLKRPSAVPSCPATKKSILRDWILIPPWVRRSVHSHIQLLSQVMPPPILWSNVPHPHVVQCHVYRCPWPWINLIHRPLYHNNDTPYIHTMHKNQDFGSVEINQSLGLLFLRYSKSSTLYIYTWVVHLATASLRL